MSRLQQTVSAISITRYRTQQILYAITRTVGSLWMLAPIIVIGGSSLGNSQYQTQDQLTFKEITVLVCAVVWLACKILYPQLKPGEPPRLYQKPAPPPPPPPRATMATGRPDDPDEATVIGRLDPKLRDLLRQKSSGPPS